MFIIDYLIAHHWNSTHLRTRIFAGFFTNLLQDYRRVPECISAQQIYFEHLMPPFYVHNNVILYIGIIHNIIEY